MIGLVTVRTAGDCLFVGAVRHDHPVQRRRVTRVRDVGFDVERHVEDAADAVTHVQRRHERQDERATRADSPRREHLPEIRLGRVDVEPRSGRVKQSGDADGRVDQKTAELIPRPPELGPAETAERPGGKFQVHAEIVELLDRRARQDRSVDPAERIDDIFHAEIRHREHRTVESLDRVVAGQGEREFARRPRPFGRSRFRRGSTAGKQNQGQHSAGQSQPGVFQDAPPFPHGCISSASRFQFRKPGPEIPSPVSPL